MSLVETVDVGSATQFVVTLLRTPRKVLIVSASQEGAGGLHELSQVGCRGPGTPHGPAAGGVRRPVFGLPSGRPPVSYVQRGLIRPPDQGRQGCSQPRPWCPDSRHPGYKALLPTPLEISRRRPRLP